jgi:hypothetical protein
MLTNDKIDLVKQLHFFINYVEIIYNYLNLKNWLIRYDFT